MDYRRLVIGDWLLSIEYGRQSRISVPLHSTPYALHQKRQRPRLYTLHPTLYTISASAPASNLSPYRLIYLPFGSVLTQMPQADAGAVRSSAGQNRNLARREINSANCSKNIVIVFGATLIRRMRVREMDKTGAVKSYLNGLWISHLSGDA